MNEFDLMGPQFLSMYVPATLSTIFGAVVLRYALKLKSGSYKELDLSAYDAAYLSGGDNRVVDTAVAKLLVAKVLDTSIAPQAISVAGELPNNAHSIEQKVVLAVRNNRIRSVRDIYRCVGPISQAIRPKLIEAGLIVSDAKTAAARSICTLIILCPVLFWGVPKLMLGLSRSKPVGILSFLILAGLAAAAWFFCQTRLRTDRGDAAVAFLQAENRALEYSVKFGSTPSLEELSMATGLFGTTILLTSPLFAPMRTAFAPPVSTSSSFSSGGCGSSCGGGGCGGGGCGGCGG